MKILVESKQDIQSFIDKFGEDRYERYKKQKTKIVQMFQPKAADMTWCVKNMGVDALDTLLSVTQSSKSKLVGELKEICAMPEANDVTKIYSKDGYEIYKINTPEASVKYGLVVGGKAKWCISGGYYNNEGALLTEAIQYFYQYQNFPYDYTGYYFCFTPDGDKYALCPHKDMTKPSDIWDRKDDEVKEIPGLNEPIVYMDDIVYKPYDEYNDNQSYDIALDFINSQGENPSDPILKALQGVEKHDMRIGTDGYGYITGKDGSTYQITIDPKKDAVSISLADWDMFVRYGGLMDRDGNIDDVVEGFAYDTAMRSVLSAWLSSEYDSLWFKDESLCRELSQKTGLDYDVLLNAKNALGARFFPYVYNEIDERCDTKIETISAVYRALGRMSETKKSDFWSDLCRRGAINFLGLASYLQQTRGIYVQKDIGEVAYSFTSNGDEYIIKLLKEHS